MKLLHVVMAMLPCLVTQAMNFNSGDRVRILDGVHKGKIAIVQSSFSALVPGKKITACMAVPGVLSYLADVPCKKLGSDVYTHNISVLIASLLKNNSFVDESLVYCVRSEGRDIFVHQTWMKSLNEEKMHNESELIVIAKK